MYKEGMSHRQPSVTPGPIQPSFVVFPLLTKAQCDVVVVVYWYILYTIHASTICLSTYAKEKIYS